MWVPLRRALANPVFRDGLREFLAPGPRWSHAFNYLIVLAIVLFITWPKEGLVSLRDLPFTYNALGGTMVIILTYLNFTQGARKQFGASYALLRDWLAVTPLPAAAFVRGYVAAGLLDLVLFAGISLPLLLLAAGVAGESLAHVAYGMLTVGVCAGSYRVLGVTLLLWLERDEFLLYILVRLCYVFFLLGSGFIVPLGNPVLAFVDTSIWPQRLGSIAIAGLTLRGWRATVALHLLLVLASLIIATVRARRLQRAAAAAEGG
ncbi:MAG: hypothetical protein KatS3mg131_0662 [Candidatus Tectimicrobiota bacterium]|nr:MAG: hypothetical protein KatS3mg131_0662 [Candidatus Tectomicrobia bacterium]